MTFEQWWKSKWPATIDEAGFALLEEAWQMAFCDGYEKGVAAFHEAEIVRSVTYDFVSGEVEISVRGIDRGNEYGPCLHDA